MDARTLLLAALLISSACATRADSGASPSTPAESPSAPVPSPSALMLYWATHQTNRQPHYSIIFEGGSPSQRVEAVRIGDRAGGIVGSATTVAAEGEALYLCVGKSGERRRYGLDRATVTVDERTFNDFYRNSHEYTVSARVGGDWRQVQPTFLCASTE